MAQALFPHRAEAPRTSRRLNGRLVAAFMLAAVFLGLLIDALVHPVAFFDIWLMRLIQRPDDPAIWPVLDAVKALTGSQGAVIAWVIAGLVFLLCRWWAPAVALGLIPIGGVINEGVSLFLVERSRPHVDGLYRSSLNYEDHSFPSGHVTGAVLLYGLIFVVARRIPHVVLRSVIQSASIAVLAAVGFQRPWGGAHWPSDVLAAYALGGLLLIGLVALHDALDSTLTGLSLPAAVGRTVFLGANVAGRAVRFTAHGPIAPSFRPATHERSTDSPGATVVATHLPVDDHPAPSSELVRP